MSHWNEEKPTRYRAKAGPEVVLRKVSVLFCYKFYAETGHRDRQSKVVLRRVPVLFRYRFYAEMSHRDRQGKVVLRRVPVLFAISSRPNFLFTASAVFSYGAFIS